LNNHLAPTLKYNYGDYFLLWFASSNTYNIVDSNFDMLLELYFSSDSIETLKSDLLDSKLLSSDQVEETLTTIHKYLTDCNYHNTNEQNIEPPFPKKATPICKHIQVLDKKIKLYFDSEIVQKTIFPALAHLQIDTEITEDIHFSFFLHEGYLYMLQDNAFVIKVPKLDYHLLQGKFIFKLLCEIHNKQDSDWVGTFHGCTITKNDRALFITGVSGKGKSTLSTLLASSGFGLLADDVSPLLAKDLNLYYNPSAVSIKTGSFNILKSYVKNFDAIKQVEFNASKGAIKYISFNPPKHKNYTCHAILLVNYKVNSETLLEEAQLPEVLNAFIADSWLSPSIEHAKHFMNWLSTLHFYKLTYSDTKNAIAIVNDILSQNI